MADYISREALIDRLNKNLSACNHGTFSEMCYADAIETVKHLPAADVEPVRHGWWDVNRRCSECGNPAPLAYSKPDRWKSPYCPNCGSKMDLEGENNENFSK